MLTHICYVFSLFNWINVKMDDYNIIIFLGTCVLICVVINLFALIYSIASYNALWGLPLILHCKSLNNYIFSKSEIFILYEFQFTKIEQNVMRVVRCRRAETVGGNISWFIRIMWYYCSPSISGVYTKITPRLTIANIFSCSERTSFA